MTEEHLPLGVHTQLHGMTEVSALVYCQRNRPSSHHYYQADSVGLKMSWQIYIDT